MLKIKKSPPPYIFELKNGLVRRGTLLFSLDDSNGLGEA